MHSYKLNPLRKIQIFFIELSKNGVKFGKSRPKLIVALCNAILSILDT